MPAPLWQAIVTAGNRYNVPPLVLAAVWRGESGSSYPNPYVNAEGYGGLFGTTLWNGSTQDQANLAAQIFHNGLVASHGNILAANGYYATGHVDRPGIYGHAGLPTGTVPGYGGQAHTVTPNVTGTGPGTPTGMATSRPRPGNTSGGGILDTIGGWFSSAGSGILSGLGAAAQTAAGFVTGPAEFLKLAVWLIMPQTWLRIFEVLVGAALMLLSLRGLALVLASRGEPVDFYTLGGAARSLHQRKIRPGADTLVPGNAARRKTRRAAGEKAAKTARLSEEFGDVIPF